MGDGGPEAVISVSALRHNLRLTESRVAPASVLAVVKDDAYGHGRDAILDVLLNEGVTRFGALDLPSAVAVRSRSRDAMAFAWVFDRSDDLSEAVRLRIDLGVTDEEVLERVAAAAASADAGPAHIHLKIDTGLHRAGVLPSRWKAFVMRAAELEHAGHVRVVGLWTHLAEESDDDDTRAIEAYRSAVGVAAQHGVTDVTLHVAASAASFAREDARFDMVRVGAFLYGIAPGSGTGPAELGLRPVMTLRAPVRALVKEEGRTLAEVGVGGAAGIPQDAAGSVSVALAGRRHEVVAVEPLRLLIDVTDAVPAAGEIVTLFGDGASGEPTLQEWADAIGTIGEEIVTRLSGVIPRRISL